MPIKRPKAKPQAKPFHPPQHWLDIALDLLRLPTAPFHEQNVMQRLMGLADERGLVHWFDAANNLFVQYKGNPPPHRRPPGANEPLGPGMLAFSAHVDHPGFWALEMTGKKDLEAHWMGGVPAELFAGAKVMFWTRKEMAGPANYDFGGEQVRGTVVKVLSEDERKRPVRVKIRVERPVAPGSIGMWDLPDPAIKDEKLYARGIDDVAGAASLMCLLDELARTKSEHWVLGIFTRAEEGGFFGCLDLCRQMAAASGQVTSAGAPHGRRVAAPARIIGVETSKRLANVSAGDGPIVRVGDARSVFDPALTAWEAATAEKLAKDDPTFRFQRKLMDGGACETSVYQAFGFSAGALAIPLANYHNVSDDKPAIVSEYVDVSDFGNLVRLELALVENYHALKQGSWDFRAKCEERYEKYKHLFSDPAGRAV